VLDLSVPGTAMGLRDTFHRKSQSRP